MIIACKNGDFELVKILLDHGADKNIKSEDGQSALDIGES